MRTNNEIKKLTPGEVDEFFEKHLRYRRIMLMSEKIVKIPDIDNKGAIEICMHEISKVVCRLFLEFMGIGLDNKKYNNDGVFDITEAQEKKNPDDFKIVDLGGDWVDISKLKKEERKLLAKVILTANKSAVHFTHGGYYGGDRKVISPGVDIIDKLLRKHLYDKLNKEVKPF